MKIPGMTIVGAWTSPAMTNAAKLAMVAIQRKTASDEGGAATLIGTATTPERDGGVDDERDKEHVGELGNDHPWIGNTDRTRDDRAPPKHHLVQRENLAKVDVHARHEIQAQREQPDAGGQVCEPESPGVEIEMHEPDNRQNDHGKWDVGPAQHGGVAGSGLRLHHRQLERAENSGREGKREEQQVGVLRSLLEPDEKMDDTQRQTGRGHHDPGDLDPVHIVADTERAASAIQ